MPEGNLMSGQIMLTGRSKDTITLLDGENVPPQPIEDALCRSALLEHVMLIGQDKRTLGALVCLSTEELERRMKVSYSTPRYRNTITKFCPIDESVHVNKGNHRKNTMHAGGG